MSCWDPDDGVNIYKDDVLLGNIKVVNNIEKESLSVKFSSHMAGRESFGETIQYDLLNGQVVSHTIE